MSEKVNDLAERLKQLEKKRQALIEDLKWREADYEDEVKELKSLAAREDPESLELIGAQKIVVETIEKVLDAERKELAEVEGEITALKEEMKRLAHTEKSAAPGPSE